MDQALKNKAVQPTPAAVGDMAARTKDTREEKARVIKNHDLILLSMVQSCKQEVQHIRAALEWQEEQMFHITQSYSGMPSGHGMAKGIDDALAKADEMKARHLAKMDEYLSMIEVAYEIMDSIKSVNMRAFVNLMYVQNLPKQTVMARLNMSEWNYRKARDSVEQAPYMTDVAWCERYVLAENGK